MTLKIDFEHPIWEEAVVRTLKPCDLDDFYVCADEVDRLSLYFHLETTYHYFRAKGKNELAAHMAYLTAYYLFVPLTPPASEHLADYQEWQNNIEAGK